MSMILDSIEFVPDGRHKIGLRIQRSCLSRNCTPISQALKIICIVIVFRRTAIFAPKC